MMKREECKEACKVEIFVVVVGGGGSLVDEVLNYGLGSG